MEQNEIKILWYNIKFYDNHNKIIETIQENKLKQKINFWETINNWQWSLDIVLNSDEFKQNDDVFACKVFFIVNINGETREEHIYTWKINENILRSSSYNSDIVYNFIWLYWFYADILNFIIKPDTGDNYLLEYTYEEENNNIFFVQDNILKSVWFTELKVSWLALPWQRLLWLTTWYTAEIIYHNYNWTDRFIWIYKQNWTFDVDEICKIQNYDLWTNTWSDSWFYTTILDYRVWENYASYFLSFDTSEIFWLWLKNIKVEDKINNSLLDYLKDLNSWYFYFVDKQWKIHFKQYWETDLLKTLTFDKEIIEIEKKIDKNEIKNYIIVSNWTDEVVVYDKVSINKNWRKELKIKDTNLLNIATLQERGNKELEEKKEWITEVNIRLNIKKYIMSVLYKTWEEMTLDWNSYSNIKIKDLQTYIEWWSVFNINIWDRLNVRNLEYSNTISNMVVVRKEFDGDFMNIYLWNYTKNYAMITGWSNVF